MTRKDVILSSSKKCSVCIKKMHHAQTVVAMLNAKGKIKAYCCNDDCAHKYHSAGQA
jgi:hypothetical protein